MKPRQLLERKIRRRMEEAVCIGPVNEMQKRIVKESERLAGYFLRLCTAYFFLGVISVVIGQIIYRVVL